MKITIEVNPTNPELYELLDKCALHTDSAIIPIDIADVEYIGIITEVVKSLLMIRATVLVTDAD